MLAARYNSQVSRGAATDERYGRVRAIAIDGPVAAGKTTVGRLLARRLGYRFVDTGAMYRAITWLALQRDVDITDAKALVALAEEATIEVNQVTPDGEPALRVNGCDVTGQLRTPEVEGAVSLVSRTSGVRIALVAQQRKLAQEGRVVMAGRDIGTVVLPQADIKVFLRASPGERARRRLEELRDTGQDVSYEDVLSDLARRDKLDTERADSPLRPAEDARIVDTDSLSLEEVVSLIEKMVRGR
ncbi:MAG: (d)CMP kinase [Chloroflexi bacterium]|nr:(d)CMP kinase [Chloroflexota bacterium]